MPEYTNKNIEREKGITTILIGGLTVQTDKINRHQYNRLRKRKVIDYEDVLKAIKWSGNELKSPLPANAVEDYRNR